MEVGGHFFEVSRHVFTLSRKTLQISTTRKHSTRPSDNDRANVRILGTVYGRVHEIFPHLEVERICRLWSVQSDTSNFILYFKQYRCVLHVNLRACSLHIEEATYNLYECTRVRKSAIACPISAVESS